MRSLSGSASRSGPSEADEVFDGSAFLTPRGETQCNPTLPFTDANNLAES